MSTELEVAQAEIQALRQTVNEYLEANVKLRTLSLLCQNQLQTAENVKTALASKNLDLEDQLKALKPEESTAVLDTLTEEG